MCPYASGLNSAGTSTRFVDKTPDEVLEDFSNALQYMSSTANGVEVPDTIAIDQAHIYTSRLPLSCKWLEDNLPGIKFERAGELQGTSEYNPFTGQNVIVIYKKHRNKLEIEILQMFNQLPAETRNLAFVVNCEMRLSITHSPGV